MPRLLAIVLPLLLLAARADSVDAQAPDEALHRTVAELDDSVFGAFNARDLDGFLRHFSEDLEFYHDVTGLTGYADLITSSRRLLSQESPLRRRLVEGSLEVHEVPGHGAIQIGRHEFCHEEDGVDDCGVFGFTHLWHRTDDGWKITRVFSYGH